MLEKENFFKERFVPGEDIVDLFDNIKFDFRHGQPDTDYKLYTEGCLALTTHRLMVQWMGGRQTKRVYSVLWVHSLSERYSIGELKWPYQAILTLSNEMRLVVEPITANRQLAKQLSTFLNQVLFSLGKQVSDSLV
jgi:hypothetical protein